MPKGAANSRSRGPYAAQACTICRARKSKCDGVKPVCGSCGASGRDDECSWARDTAPPRRLRTQAHFEALERRAESLQTYADLLEGILAKCVCQDVASHLQLRPRQLEEPHEQDDGDLSDTDVLDSDEEITHELTIPAQCLKLDDNFGGPLVHGMTFRFRGRPPNEVSKITCIDAFEEPNACYVLLVDGADVSGPSQDVDWSRNLPLEMRLERKEHDRALDLSFKFFSNFGMRIVPPLFLRDMHRALSVPRSQRPPRTPHYSPMLHNALLSVSLIFSDDPYARDPKTRQIFAEAARACLETECRKPDTSLVQALAWLGTYYTELDDRILGEIFIGMSSRMSASRVDSKAWVKSGLIAPEEMLSRNWAHWSTFCMEVCWALYFGRDFCGGPLSERRTPLPFVDSQFDEILWDYAPANIPPQPSYISLTFLESTSLFVIARKIIDLVNGQRDGTREEMIKVDENITKIDLELNNWRSHLPPQLDITPANQGLSTPDRLMLHFQYWWCLIVLHRPFFSHQPHSIQHAEHEIDHVKLCKRAADSILELAETWSSLYTLRLAPATLLQVLFGAGTVYMLLALQATARFRIAHAALEKALAQVERCVRYLYEVGQSWRCARRTADSLAAVLRDKLKPVLARRLAQKGAPITADAPASSAGTSAACEPDAARFPCPDPATAYTTDWNPQIELDAAWSEPSIFTRPQSHVDLSAGFPLTGENVFPELDMGGILLPTVDFFGAPELWGLFNADSNTGNEPPLF
ncbi:fungal-specific transcription factor domain-containing protein [Mycena rosella]|uniref:Fungal-specific transcription factor domain-containing protein n=1 Tax=Mycena rosella TaxID=1033263 RepID=A0AAD7GST1_MYCRO|nr:fungal-specific transcription factor domain-containing protein [Mycena rosella]